MTDETIRVRAAGSDGFPDAPATGISEADIVALVHGFYARVRDDDLIGPIFGREIAADRWPAHLDKMCAFWSSVVLRTRRYDGRPLPPHLRLDGLDAAHFGRWLALFRETAVAVLAPEAAAVFIDRAERIAHSFRLAIAFHRGQDSVAMPMLRAGD